MPKALRHVTRKAPLSVTSLRGLTTFRQAFALALEMHPTAQQPVDMTWGHGAMWKGIRNAQPLRCDGNPTLPDLDVCALWQDLPVLLGRGTRELVVADPIHVDDVGATSAWRKRYAIRSSGPAADGSVVELLGQVLTAGRELLHQRRGTLLLKVADQNHADRPQRHAYAVNKFVDELELYVCGQWTMPSRSMTDTRRQTVRHYPSALHLFVLHPQQRCLYAGLHLVGRTRCGWCTKPIVVQRIGTRNYCCAAHKQAAYRERTKATHGAPVAR